MLNTMSKKQQLINDIHQYGIDQLKNGVGGDAYGCDLHNYLYNQDYYTIGTYQAKQELEKYGTFDAIDKIQEYEKDMFGEVNTDLGNAESVINMLAYIVGEEFLQESETLQDKWNETLTQADIEQIIEELENV